MTGSSATTYGTAIAALKGLRPKCPPLNARLLEAPPVPGEEVVTVRTPRGAGVRILLSFPDSAPSAAVLLFVGDHGNLQLSDDGRMAWGEKNFLMRTRHLFRAAGFVVAQVDAPDDRQNTHGLYGFRATREHADDVAAVAAFVRKRADVPVWAVGTSRGAETAANAAAWRNDGSFAGIGLVAAVTRPAIDFPTQPGSVFASPLKRINVPVLLVHHVDDACAFSPCGDIPQLCAALTSAPVVEVMLFGGGLPPEGDPCRPYHAHGFFGIEEAVVADMAASIRLLSLDRIGIT